MNWIRLVSTLSKSQLSSPIWHSLKIGSIPKCNKIISKKSKRVYNSNQIYLWERNHVFNKVTRESKYNENAMWEQVILILKHSNRK